MRIYFTCCLLTTFLILIGCSTGITRDGYSIQDIQAFNDYSNCRIAVKRDADFAVNKVTILGQITVYDTQFSVKCDEEYVLSLLKKEACAMGAHVLNITEEKQPNFWSTCYQVKAQYLKLNNKQDALMIDSDPQYEWSLVQRRAAKGRERQEAVISGSVLGGAIGGAIGGQ